jgi:hypothetical protein
MSRPFSLRRSSSVFIRAMLCALLLPVCVAVSAQTNRPAATQEGRQPALVLDIYVSLWLPPRSVEFFSCLHLTRDR